MNWKLACSLQPPLLNEHKFGGCILAQAQLMLSNLQMLPSPRSGNILLNRLIKNKLPVKFLKGFYMIYRLHTQCRCRLKTPILLSWSAKAKNWQLPSPSGSRETERPWYEDAFSSLKLSVLLLTIKNFFLCKRFLFLVFFLSSARI